MRLLLPVVEHWDRDVRPLEDDDDYDDAVHESLPIVPPSMRPDQEHWANHSFQ